MGVTWSPPNDATKVYYFNVHGPSGISSIREFNSNSPSNGSSITNTIAAVRLNGVKGYDQTQVWANYLTNSNPNGLVYPEENVLGDDLSDYTGYDPDIALTSFGVMFKARKQIGEIVESSPTNNVILQVGPNSGDTFPIKLSDARTSALGIEDIAVDPPEKAVEAIGKLDAAINKVSSERSKFGSYQNALEHIYNNVSNYEVNLTEAESRIADADIAKEIMQMTKEQILSQSTQAMLTHAVQAPEAVLSLLK
ncbi:flagellin [Paenibacillus naphthalenovorans]|uniref:Flagellin n=1 Tax=Paenibacillus naphthalenovorans TaxID=162209 RepID=A0A0U2UDS6_9BACL|nr:flagellin [Paenibacillus naphthalenovorans]ALS24361.1 flagellin [Paenibacillus naphthalenovorans]